jgi:hypothetical protein
MTALPPSLRYSPRQVRWGLILAVVVGVLLTATAMTFWSIVENAIAARISGLPASVAKGPQLVMLWTWFKIVLIVGLPVALVVGLPIGLVVFERTGLAAEHRIWRFAAAGAGCAGIVSVIATLVIALTGYWQSIDPAHFSTTSMWGRVVQTDGIRTGFGWLITGYTALRFIVIGAIAATTARLIIGPPRHA